MTAFFQSLGMSYDGAWFTATIAGILLIALPVMLVPHPGAAGGYVLFSIFGACAYAAAVIESRKATGGAGTAAAESVAKFGISMTVLG